MSDDLERLRQERMRQLIEQQRGAQEQELVQQQLRKAEIEAQIRIIIKKILTPKARERLANIRIARPDFARQIEILLIQLYQTGRLPKQITDEQLKEMLEKLRSKKREIKIRRA
ncbi:MAG: DNA-binding protein [Candidatus Altiarchaeales archaeon]|nr:MAG: DNA-binding protein [Candidatus Altiarchaeales archaeon]